MKCKFEHDGDCCNSGSTQYMCKCKPDVCHSAVPMSNADCIRAMSDEELADQFTVDVDGLMDCRLYLSVPTGKMLVSRAEAVRITLDWLRGLEEED